MTRPLRILLADDHTLFRRGIELLLAARPDFEVVGSAADGCEALTLARTCMPDVILMDLEMPRCNGLQATRCIKQDLPHVKIVMLTVSDDDDKLFEAIKSGASGYLLKDLEPYQLFDMLAHIRQGEAPLSGLMAAKILKEYTHSSISPHQEAETLSEEECTDALSAREIEVLQLVVDGMSNREIADALTITENTVKNHLSNILTKLHLQNRIQVAVYAVRHGLVQEPVRTSPVGG
jgi:DNA-binding NarL/FixJ family response regulator